MSTIRNSCIVNNANIAVQNINNTPLDAINNWWGMPIGATHDNIPSGDAVGQNVIHAPHLSTMPFLCDLTSADWIPFSEQDLQHAINSHIPYLGGIAFALIDFEWGRGAKFDILTHPNYGNLYDVAYISIKPNPTGDLITLQLDITRLPTDETVRQIVTCELVPLFVNSLQQVQNRYVSPSQHIASMVVMERDLMMRFTPPTEITPEPTPEFVLNYDASCLPNLTPPSETTPEPGDGESLNLVSIPPLEGEFTLLETGTMQESNCTGIEPVGFECMLGEDEVFTYSNPNPDFAFISINNPDGGDIITINHHPDIPNELYIGTSPSWGVVNHDENHYRLASVCYSATHGNRACFWDSLEDDYTMIDLSAGSPMMSPLGTKVLHRRGVGKYLYTIGSSQIPRIYPNHNTSQWSTDTIFYLQYDVYTQYGVPTGEKRIITYPYTGTNSIIVSDNNLQTLFDVNANGDILYWKRIGSDYQLWRYIHSSQTNTPMLPVMPKMSRVHWSPDGTTFILLYETVINGPACIRWYDLLTATPETDNYLTIACDIQGQVDWAGNIDLRFMLPEPNPDPECSDPNDFRNLTEENTNLADREACWLRYLGIIYLTIHHEFSLDKGLVFNPNELSNQLFQYATDVYNGKIDTGGMPIEVAINPNHSISPRILTIDELAPFDMYDGGYNPYYLFARALLNGMSGNNYLTPNQGPMRYFIQNYRSTISRNWMGSGNYCGGKVNSEGFCLDEDWYTTITQSVYKNKLSYIIVEPYIRMAIHDMVYGVDSEPDWMSEITSVVPSNIRLQEEWVYENADGIEQNVKIKDCFPLLGPPFNRDAFVFRSYLGYRWQLVWAWYNSSYCSNSRIFHALSIWNASIDDFTPLNELDNATIEPYETLSQAYMRHLRESYGSGTFNSLMCGEQINVFGNVMTRFGASNRAVIMPVLKVEFYERPEENQLTPIRQIIWYHYRFLIGSGSSVNIPNLSNLTMSDGEFVIFEEINGEMRPVEPLPVVTRTCP